jgi:predicted dehydrogenase
MPEPLIVQPQRNGADRRSFLQSAAVISAFPASSYARVLGANDRIGIGLIGFGLIGRTHLKTFQAIPTTNIVAIADCYRPRAEEGAAEAKTAGATPTVHTDFRSLLDQKAVDGVIVATPDHWHALMTMLACAAGKDVYVEKPLTLFVKEGDWIQQVAQRTKRVVQVGTQQRSGPHYSRARDLIRQGQIGTVSSVRMTAIRNVSPGFGRPADGNPPPGLDYDRWLGPAPSRPYNPNRGLYHFRWFWDYSGGQMTNLGAHHLDIIDWILGLGTLSTVASVGGRFVLTDNGETPDTQDAIFHCGSYTISFTMREASLGEAGGFGLTFHGHRGSLGIHRRGFKITPDLDMPPSNQIPGVKSGHPAGGPVAVEHPEAKPRTAAISDMSGDPVGQYTGHAKNFLDCIRSRATPISDLASAQRTAVACHLANLALRLGRSLRWDASRQAVVNDAEANAALSRPYRAPWDKELDALLKG